MVSGWLSRGVSAYARLIKTKFYVRPHLAEVLAGLRLELVDRAIVATSLPGRDLKLARRAREARARTRVVALGGVAAGFARGAARSCRAVIRRPAGHAGGEGRRG